MKIPLMLKPLHHYADRSEAPDWLREADRKLSEADAVVVVSAEYNHCIPPALSNLLDHFPGSSFSYKPSGIVCYSMGKLIHQPSFLFRSFNKLATQSSHSSYSFLREKVQAVCLMVWFSL